MIIKPGATFKCDGWILQCVSVVDECGVEIHNLLSADTKKGTGQLATPDEKISFKQLYFVVTAGPSEQVVQETQDAAAPQEESHA